MDKLIFYEECKKALRILNSQGIIKPNEYSDAVVAKLRDIGANAVYAGIISSRKTREAEALCAFDDMIEDERQKRRTERRAQRAEIVSFVSIAIALAALLTSLLC